jgi:hypothetical protein
MASQRRRGAKEVSCCHGCTNAEGVGLHVCPGSVEHGCTAYVWMTPDCYNSGHRCGKGSCRCKCRHCVDDAAGTGGGGGGVAAQVTLEGADGEAAGTGGGGGGVGATAPVEGADGEAAGTGGGGGGVGATAPVEGADGEAAGMVEGADEEALVSEEVA